jgi:hypothetical protein
MTNEDVPAAGEGAADARDPELAAALAVAPLDEMTRRRLVRRAVAAADDAPLDAGWQRGAGGRRTAQITAAVGVAAALVIGAVVGTVIVTRPDDPTPTAARAPETSAGERAEGAAPDPAVTGSGDAEAPRSAAALAVDLGDLGSVTAAADLRPVVERRVAERSAADATAALPAWPCRDTDPTTIGLAAVHGIGTAQVDGAAVSVLVGPTPAGETVVVLLDAVDACRFRESFPLGA